MKLRVFLLIVLVGTSEASTRRDLDVAVPPGTPIEWLREACRSGRGRGSVPTTPEGPREGMPRETSEGQTPKDDVGRTTTFGLDFGATDPFAYARVLTQDIAGHLQWVVPTPGTLKEEGPVGGGLDANWSYPPLPTETLYWYVLAAYLRRLLHPSLMSEPETIAFLTELGEPSLMAAEQAKNEKSCAELVKAIRDRVTPLPNSAPDVRETKDAHESMLYRLATEELTSGYAYELNPYFAERTLSFGSKAVPVLADLARDKHTFLARNAAAVLAGVPDSEAGDALLKLLKATKDAVVRQRVLSGLVRRRHPGTVDALLELSKHDDAFMRPVALQMLGLLGDKKAVPVILEAAKKGVDDANVLWSAIPALGRIRDAREDVVKFLKEQETRLATPPAGLFDPVRDPKDPWQGRQYAIDPPGTKARVIWEMALIALARLGDADARKKLIAELEAGRKLGTNLRQRMQPSTFCGFLTPNFYALLETLVAMGKDGEPWLKAAVEFDREDPAVRLQCLLHLSVPKPDVALLKRLIDRPEQPPALRAMALRLLGEHDPKEAEKQAKALLTAYIAADPVNWEDPAQAGHASGFTFVVTTAMHFLGAYGRNEPEPLLKVAKRALDDFNTISKIKKPPPPPDPRLRWYQKQTVIIRAPILEVALYELGRTRSEAGLDRLVEILKDTRLKIGRAEAALALGAVRAKARRTEIESALVDALEDRVGWVRWCASRGLKAAADVDVEIDWINASAAAREDAVRRIRALLK